jgi:leucyl aminopeptidase
LALFVHEDQVSLEALGLPESVRKAAVEAGRKLGFKGRLGESRSTLLSGAGPAALQLVGLGPAGKLTVDRLGRLLQGWAGSALDGSTVAFAPSLLRVPAAQGRPVALRLLSGADRFYQDFLKTKKKELSVGVLASGDATPEEADAVIAEAMALRAGAEVARETGHAPGNLLTPMGFARRARELAKHYGWKVEVLGVPELKKRKLPGLVMVGRGSENPPVLVRLSAGRRVKRVLIGKGVTFDSGGISIKTPAGMDEMKYDKCGAAIALGTLVALSELGRADGTAVYLPLAENLPGGRAFRPGDILQWPDGTSVEIMTTDAEGRLILADAIHLAAREKPEFILTVATLTGAMKFSLGSVAAGLFTREGALRDRLLGAASATGEFCWELPLWEEYDEMTKGDCTTLKNSTAGAAGSITAAAFLRTFAGGTPFAHLDVAYTAYRPPSDRKFKGPTGWGVALLAHALQEPGD